MRRYAFIQQTCEEECGAACVQMVARHYGKKVPMMLVCHLVGTGQQGTTWLGLRRGADELGFHALAAALRMWMPPFSECAPNHPAGDSPLGGPSLGCAR